MKAGERYLIKNNTLSGKLIDEGIATLIKPDDLNIKDSWVVTFDGDEGREVVRFVDPDNKVS